VFQNAGTEVASKWVEVAKLTANDAAENDRVGFGVALWQNTIVIGAYHDSDNGVASGSAYVFEETVTGTSSNWEQVAKLVPDDGASFDNFGRSVAIWQDVIVVAVQADDDNGNRSGSVYVFQKNATAWSQVGKLKADDGRAYDNFDASVAIGNAIIVVGAHRDDNEIGTDAGSAYVFRDSYNSGKDWVQVAKLVGSDATTGDRYGSSVAMSGNRIALGSSYEGLRNRAAYIFHDFSGDYGSGWYEEAKLVVDGTTSDGSV
jgi:FG-GAP repeat